MGWGNKTDNKADNLTVDDILDWIQEMAGHIPITRIVSATIDRTSLYHLPGAETELATLSSDENEYRPRIRLTMYVTDADGKVELDEEMREPRTVDVLVPLVPLTPPAFKDHTP